MRQHQTDYSGQQFSQYDIIRPLDEGRDLFTYLAWDTHNDVPRSLVMLFGMADASSEAQQRFLDTLQTLHTLDHPTITPPRDYGIEGGIPYVVREYVPGGTLKQRLRLMGAMPPEEALHTLVPVFHALDYLHGQGVTHFGLRPHVMLREETGRLRLAEAGITPLALRPAYLPLGLRPYSAPELYLRVPYTHTIDLYALGAVFYEMVTGQPPFTGATYIQLMEAHLNRQIPPVEELKPGLPPTLTTVLGRAMEKSTYLRYQTAGELFEALAEAVHGERQAARMAREFSTNGSTSHTQPAKSFRHAAASTRGPNPSQLYTDALIVEGQDPARAMELYQQLIEVAPQRAQGEVIQRLYQLEQEFGAVQIHSLMVEAREARAIGDWNDVELQAGRVLSYEPTHIEARELYELGVLLSAADAHYGSAHAAATTGHWDAAFMLLRELYSVLPDYVDSEQLATIHSGNADYVREGKAIAAHEAQVLSLSFSPHSDFLATGSTDKTVRVWRMPAAELANTLDDHHTWVCSTIFSPSGDVVLAGTWEGLIKLWGMPDGTYAGVVAGQTSQIRAMAYASHDHSLLATAAGYFLTLWTMPKGKREAVIRESDRNPVTSLAFSPTGPYLISGLQDGSLRIRDVSTPGLDVLVESQPHEGPIYGVTVSPDGSLLATVSRDGTACLCDIANGDVLLALEAHESTIHDAAFNRDGSVLATAGRDKRVILWRVDDGTPLTVLEGHYDEARSVAFSPDGRILVSGGADGYIKLWSIL